jgi:hypothetical protein
MAKYGYTCQCGWRLNRGTLTRPEYAAKKEQHAFKSMESPREVGMFMDEPQAGCAHLRKELEKSRRVPSK